MKFDVSRGVKVAAAAVMLASSVCLTVSKVSATPGPSYSQSARGVAFYTKGSSGICVMSNGSSGYTLQVPATNLTNFVGYAGINLPPLGSGWQLFGNQSGTFNLGKFESFFLGYSGSATADPGLRVVVQDNSGFMHLSQRITSSEHRGSFTYSGLGAGGSDWTPLFANSGMSVNKAAVMFYGGSTNHIVITTLQIQGADTVAGDFGCGQLAPNYSFCPQPGTDAHFNYFFDQLNNCS